MMLKNEKQYKSAKITLQKWVSNRDVLKARAASGAVAEWVLEEENFAIEQAIKQLEADVQEFEDTVTGKKLLPAPVTYAQELPDLLIRWRLAKHWTQKQLAERVGMHENQLQKYESENYGCASLQTITKIATVLQNGEALDQHPAGS